MPTVHIFSLSSALTLLVCLTGFMPESFSSSQTIDLAVYKVVHYDCSFFLTALISLSFQFFF